MQYNEENRNEKVENHMTIFKRKWKLYFALAFDITVDK